MKEETLNGHFEPRTKETSAIISLKSKLMKSGYTVKEIIESTDLSNASIVLTNGISVDIDEDGYAVTKPLPDGKFLCYPPRRKIADVITDIENYIR